MTEAYIHLVSMQGRCPNDPAFLPDQEHAMDGVLLLMSTSSHRLRDYIVLHSPEEYGMGFGLHTWRYRGTLESNGYSYSASNVMN